MTENVRLFELQIKGANSVKELKEEISLLRDRLVQLDNTSEEYSKTVEDLIEDEKKLKEVMSASKEALNSATGSYNSLVNEMGALKKVWREVTSEAERAKIGERISEINEELKRMDSTIGNNQRRVGSYEEAFQKALLTPQQELKKLRVQLAQMEEGTAEYNETFKRMSELTHDVAEQQQMLKLSSADLGDILGNLAGVAQGVAGGMSAINAISGLIADGNEDVEKAMLTTQRWLQLIQGLGAIEDLGKKVKGLITGLNNFAESQNTVVASLGDFADETKTAGDMANTTSASLTRQGAIMRSATNATLELAEGMKLLNNEELEQIEVNRETIAIMEDTIASLKAENITIREQIQLKKLNKEEGEELIKFNEETIKIQEEEIINLKKKNSSIKTSADANKKLATTQATVATTTQTASTATAGFTGALGKAVVGVRTLGATIKSALISSGIGILIVALGTLISSLWKYIDGSAKAEERTKKLKEATDALNESLKEQEKGWEREEKMLNAQGVSYEVLYDARMKNLNAQLAEVQTELKVQEAIAKDIGKKKLQKAKYDEFRQTLEELRETEKKLKEQIDDLNWDKQVNEVKKVTEANKKAEEERKRAYEQRMRDYNNEQKEAKKLYDTLKDYYKSDLAKLTAKYREEYKLLSKMNVDKETIIKAQALLTRKYEIESKELLIKTTKDIWDRIRTNNAKNIELIGDENKAYYEAQIKEAERYRDSLLATQGNLKAGNSEAETFAYLNAFEGTDIQNINEFNTELAIAKQRVDDAKKALIEFQSTQIMTKLGKDFDKLGMEATSALTRFEMAIEKTATSNKFYTGISPKELRAQLEERYRIQFEFLNKEIELYKEVLKQKNLTDEDRSTVQANLLTTQMKMQDLVTQKTIESNYLMIDSYQIMADSMQGIASSLTDVLGSVSDIIMDNAEAQLKAGKITEEEYNRQFEKSKAIQIAQATINTIAGAVGAFMGITRDTGGWGIAFAVAQAAAVLAAGMAQIQQIKNTTPSSSGGSDKGRYAEVTPNSTSDYKPTLVSNATSGQETQDLANALGQTNIWVSVTDIDNAQQKGRVRVAESSF